MRHQLKIMIVFLALIALGIFIWQSRQASLPPGAPPPEPTTLPDIPATPSINTTNLPLRLAPGFSISIFAEGLGKPRVLARDPKGVLLVSLPSQGKVVALPDKNGDGQADEIKTILEGLNRPHGLAFAGQPRLEKYCRDTADVDRGGLGGYCAEVFDFFIAESHRVARYVYDPEGTDIVSNFGQKVMAALPDGGEHFTRTLLMHPGQRLLITVGSSCNACEESDDRRAKMLAVDVTEENPQLKTFASGLRNAVFMTRHPVTGKIWATEMGRDFLGDDLPPDEINLVEEGKNYGWPWCYGKNKHDQVFDQNEYEADPCSSGGFIPSYIDLPAHSAPLGLAFFPEKGWPAEYQNDLLVAFHGSWNRTTPTGYKVVRYKLDEQGNFEGVEDFISGWLTEKGDVLGRPVDILVQSNGVIFISDDKAGLIYRVSYGGKIGEETTKKLARCVVGGCSSQHCIEDGSEGPSTCEWFPEYACYSLARCERQTNGACGWTVTKEVEACFTKTWNESRDEGLANVLCQHKQGLGLSPYGGVKILRCGAYYKVEPPFELDDAPSKMFTEAGLAVADCGGRPGPEPREAPVECGLPCEDTQRLLCS
ncbi:PQQ-dependent sugar dehydrogenase [Candidatus Uhrbacteria bacterium]|nr:PQQ-dependent sugar dehydrogenase [Candidatus Uhrbacteria bacterium]